MDIDRKIGTLRERLERSRPCRMTITLEAGKQIRTDPVGAIILFRDDARIEDAVSVTADRPEQTKLAELLNALCK